jgi:hypothetical protein
MVPGDLLIVRLPGRGRRQRVLPVQTPHAPDHQDGTFVGTHRDSLPTTARLGSLRRFVAGDYNPGPD